jgi:hypothetical protein
MATVGVLLVILLLLLTVPFLAAADPFCNNLKSVAEFLPNKTSSSPLHFATASLVQGPDTSVYALALCRGDVLNDSVCAVCIANTFDMLLNQTPSRKHTCYRTASAYDDNCMLIYSIDDILEAPPNTTGIDGEAFERRNTKKNNRLIAGAHIQELLVKTVEEAATSRLFATAVMDGGTNYPKVYSLAQCTPDLSAVDCQACLSQLLGMVNFTMSLRIGGQMGTIRCYFKYEASRFYGGEPMLHIRLCTGACSACAYRACYDETQE